jgi:hypothetical protein
LPICGTYDAREKYGRLDIVALDGATFIARRDNPGICPGDGWQALSRQGRPGHRGETGERGPRGEKGEKGEPGATVVSATKIDRSHTIPLQRYDVRDSTGGFVERYRRPSTHRYSTRKDSDLRLL